MAVNVPPLSSQSHWTVMIYMDGDNNLESAAIDDFNELTLNHLQMMCQSKKL